MRRTARFATVACFEPIAPFLPGPVHLEYDVNPGKHYTAYLRGSAGGQVHRWPGPGGRQGVRAARGADPMTGNPTSEYVEVADVGVLTTFTIIRIPFEGQKLTPPYCFGAIVLDGADSPIYHLISGGPARRHSDGHARESEGGSPKDEWETSLENILYFEPTGEP